MAGIEKPVLVTRTGGGYREIIVVPHLAYRDAGPPGLIPPRALIRMLVCLRAIVKADG
ncbi:MAG: hypothetical protein VCB07_00545 [Gammaproteobacteria bacterium]